MGELTEAEGSRPLGTWADSPAYDRVMELSYEVVGQIDAPEIVLIHGHGESPSGDGYDPISHASDIETDRLCAQIEGFA